VVLLAGSLTAVSACGLVAAGGGDDAQPRTIPTPLVPLEYLVGRWKGNGVPKNNPAARYRGWPERHSWAWFFVQGKPAGLSFTIEGDKFLATGKLTFDPKRKRYRLEGMGPEPSKRAVALEGTLDDTGKILVLERAAPAGASKTGDPKMRVSLWPNANFVRYTMTQDLQEPGAVKYTRAVEIGLTKEGESFAGGAAAADRPRCIVTGGTATLTISFEGRSIPLCCTGCLDEFKGDPDKYLKKAALLQSAQAGKTKTNQPAASRVSRSEDAFAGDVVDEEPKPAPSVESKQKPAAASDKTGTSTASGDATHSPEKLKRKMETKTAGQSPAPKPATRAAALLRLGRNLEKSGKTKAALSYFRRVVKDYPDTPAAKTAAARIKSLEKD
jgi:hypothetical protein